MRLSRLLLLPVATLAVAACGEDDGVTVNTRPPLGGVRFVNAVPDMLPMDIRMVDQVEWSASSVNASNATGLAYRGATIHWPTEAKARRIRVFPTSTDIAVTSRVLLDTTITIEANRNVTFVVVPGVRAGAPNANSETDSVQFIMIDDAVPALTGLQIAARAVNAGVPTGIDAYLTASTSTAIAGAPTWSVPTPFGAGAPYVTRDTGTFAVRATAAGVPATILASATASAGAPQSGLIGALAGFRAAGSVLSAYVFPRACPAVATPLTTANCPALVGASAATQTALQSPGIVWLVDMIPAPPVQSSGQ